MNSKIPLALSGVLIVAIIAVLFMMPSHANKPINNTNNTPINNTVVEIPYNISISTDRYSYEERDYVNVSLVITVPKEIDEANVTVFGVKNKYGSYKINKDLDFDLDAGVNHRDIRVRLPNCTSCSAVQFGEHFLAAELYAGSEVVATDNTTIELTK